MGPRLVPITMAAAMVAFAVASLSAGWSVTHPGWWAPAVALAILGGIVPMVYAVNIRIVPVFSRRRWRDESWLAAQVTLALIGAWLVWAGRVSGRDLVVQVGFAVALGGALLFTVNVVRLFKQPPGPMPAPPLPFPEQGPVDRIATGFTRLSGIYLVIGLTVGLLDSRFRLAGERWDVVWAHTMLVGFFLSMASGVSYHVLGRWSMRPWRWPLAIRLHLWLVTLGLPLMLIALATGWEALFLIAGPIQAVAVGLFIALIAPMLPGLPLSTRVGFASAAFVFVCGITLGGAFAIDPALGARLRLAHATLNLFGGAGFLISGVAYYLVPRFAGRPLRWPRLVGPQLVVLGLGIGFAAAGWTWNAYGGDAIWPIATGYAAVAVAFGLLGIMISGTFARSAVGTVSTITMNASRPTAIGQGRPAGAVGRANPGSRSVRLT